jgi:hypothetical protein
MSAVEFPLLQFTWVDNIETDFRWAREGGMDCIDLAKGRDHWRALVKQQRSFRFHKKLGSS